MEFLPILYMLGISGVTIATYKIDKINAQKSAIRVPEKTLHILALLGGSLAAFYAQRKYRHKTKKLSFQFAYWAIVTLQASLVFGALK